MSENSNASDRVEVKTVALNVAGADDKITQEICDGPCTREVQVAFGRHRQDTHFVNWSGSLYDLLTQRFTAFRSGTKDGACITQSHTTTGRRVALNMSGPTLIMLDHDTGHTMDEVAAKYEEAGLYALLWHTYSHLKETSDVTEKALTTFIKKAPKWRSQGFARPAVEDEALLLEQIQDYFTTEKHYVSSVVASMHTPMRDVKDGARYFVQHEPQHKLRSMAVLNEKFDLLNGGVQDERIVEWRERYGGFALKLGVPFDRSCTDPSRLFYLPSHPKNADASLYEVREIPGRTVVLDDMPRHNPKTRTDTNAFAAAGLELRTRVASDDTPIPFMTKNLRKFMAAGAASFNIAEWLRSVGPDDVRAERDNKLTVCCPNDDNHSNAGDPADQGFWVRNAADGENGFAAACSHDTCRSQTNNDRAIFLDMLCQKHGVEDALDLQDWCDEWKEQDDEPYDINPTNGRPAATAVNVRRFLTRVGVTVRHDQFDGRTYIDGLEDFGPELSDAAVDRLSIMAQEGTGHSGDAPTQADKLVAPDEAFLKYLRDTAQRNRFHSVRDYFDRVQHEWDGVARVDTFLARYFGAEDIPLHSAFGRCQLIGTARRARKPGSKHDEILILESPQGMYKSTALAVLAVRGEWFSDTYKLGSDSKKSIEQTQGKLIIEVGEMSGMRGNEVEALKADLSRCVDRSRMAYGKLAIDVARGFTLWGTTNDDQYLKDLTGNRRFWPVKCGVIDVEGLRRDLDQIWGEVATLEADGVSNRLPQELWSVAAEAQASRRESNDFEDRLARFLEDIPAGRVLKGDVYELAGLKGGVKQYQRIHIREAMKTLGWEDDVARLAGSSARVFVKKSEHNEPVSTYGIDLDEHGRRVFKVVKQETGRHAMFEATVGRKLL